MKLGLIQRHGSDPEVQKEAPQLQLSDISPRDIYGELVDWMFDPKRFPMAEELPTKISDPLAKALFLKEEHKAHHDDAFMIPKGSREFAHVHEDGSFHIVVSNDIEDEIIEKGWGRRHPRYDEGVKEIMVYAPRDKGDLEEIKKLVMASYEYASGHKAVG